MPSLSAADSAACAAVVAKLPPTLGGKTARPTTPTSPLTRAWGDPAITVRCGVGRPSELRVNSSIYEVDAVSWFAVFNDDRVSYYAVDRRPYVEISVPRDIGGDKVLVPVGTAIAALPHSEVDLRPSR